MTETNHGSNVKGIETTATYNHADKTFTIHTPHELARKEYIGNAAKHGQGATVFAKLILDGKDYGVSAFVVQLRDKNGNTLKGITIKDCGRKMCLNGVDNGVIYFDNVVIPKDDMLDRYASVNDAGMKVRSQAITNVSLPCWELWWAAALEFHDQDCLLLSQG